MNVNLNSAALAARATTSVVNDLIAGIDQPRKVTVIGAGAMGSGIAALIASAGIPVRLLDMRSEGESAPNALASQGIDRQRTAGGFVDPAAAAVIEIGNLADDLHLIGDSDWIIEAIVEDVDVKRRLYENIERWRRPEALVASNTSTIPIRELVAGRSDALRQNFLITHFFNPPRRMQLLEVVCGTDTSEHSRDRAGQWGAQLLGKQVVVGRDTPGFIANRLGNYWMSLAALEAIKAGLSVSEADAVASAPFGIPRTGVFGLFDFVGINLVPLVWRSLLDMLPPTDAHHAQDITQNGVFASLVSRGLIGRFGPSGFYRNGKTAGGRTREMLDFATLDYVPATSPTLASTDLRELCERDDATGRYAWTVLSSTVLYAAEIAAEIAETLDAIDTAMKTGYNWKRGPFELADQVGLDWFIAKLAGEGRAVPNLLRRACDRGSFAALEQDSSIQMAAPVTLASAKAGRAEIYRNDSASIWDLGDGVAGFEIRTKMNACDEGVVAAFRKAVEIVPRAHRALLIGSDNARAFSAGAQLDVFIAHTRKQDWSALSAFVAGGQSALLDMKYAPFPVVAAAGGLALGGGCELALHCDRIVAHAELAAGFPELNAGIIPGWGGGTQLLLRQLEAGQRPVQAASLVFDTIVNRTISGSAFEARNMGILRSVDHIVMSRDHLLASAKDLAIHLSSDYAAPPHARLAAAGAPGVTQCQSAIDAKRQPGELSDVDAGIAEELAFAICGGRNAEGSEMTEREMMALELAAILELAKRPTTLERLEHLRATNKPLRN